MLEVSFFRRNALTPGTTKKKKDMVAANAQCPVKVRQAAENIAIGPTVMNALSMAASG